MADSFSNSWYVVTLPLGAAAFLKPRLDFGVEMDGRHDHLNVFAQMRRNAVFIAGDVWLIRLYVLKHMILRVEQVFSFADGGIEIEPAHALRLLDSVRRHTS